MDKPIVNDPHFVTNRKDINEPLLKAEALLDFATSSHLEHVSLASVHGLLGVVQDMVTDARHLADPPIKSRS